MISALPEIHAYLISSKPVYEEFLYDITQNGGNTQEWPSADTYPDGYFAAYPLVGVVVQQTDGESTEEPIQFPLSSLSLSADGKNYPIQNAQNKTFTVAAVAFFAVSPISESPYFGAKVPNKTTVFTVQFSYQDIPYENDFVFFIKPSPMQTPWSEIVQRFGDVFVNDDRMKEKASTNLVRFFEETFYYLNAAIPRFNRPTRIIPFLTFSSPLFSSYSWAVPAEIQTPDATGETGTTSQPITIHTQQIGYELCSVVIYTQDQYGNPTEIPYTSAQYNPLNGTVTFPAGLTFGTQFEIDFGTDGYFDKNLTQEMKRILGLAFQLVWENRFTGDWLARAPKLTDKSFLSPNEANWTRAQEEKRRGMEQTFNEELRRYEQNCAEHGIMNGTPGVLL